jgi:hypothetical protein
MGHYLTRSRDGLDLGAIVNGLAPRPIRTMRWPEDGLDTVDAPVGQREALATASYAER